MKRVMITRLGAYGDMIIMSPLVQHLKDEGWYILLQTSERGIEVYNNDKRIDEIVVYKSDSVGLDVLLDHLDDVAKKHKVDRHINLTGSLEHLLAIPPVDPLYAYPKFERKAICDKNYYEEMGKFAGVELSSFNPSIAYTKTEEEQCQSYLKKDHFNIMWAMAGSGTNKVYPWTEYVIGEILNTYKNVHIITVGEERCQNIESHDQNYITNLSGKIPMKISMCLTGKVDLLISPDTGVLHASGEFTTPKIGLLGHTTIENISKHFINDYSIEADCACAPCFHLIYDYQVQCPIEPLSKASWCMAEGLDPMRVFKQIEKVIPSEYRK